MDFQGTAAVLSNIKALCPRQRSDAYENISISIREEGYIITNILSTGKMFRVGEENTKAFVDYVLDECDGYEIVYSSNPSDSIPE